MNKYFFDPKEFFTPAIFLSISIHGLMIGLSSWMAISDPEFYVVREPSSLEITVVHPSEIDIQEKNIQNIVPFEMRTKNVISDISDVALVNDPVYDDLRPVSAEKPTMQKAATTEEYYQKPVPKVLWPDETVVPISAAKTVQRPGASPEAVTGRPSDVIESKTLPEPQVVLSSQGSQGASHRSDPLPYINPAPLYPRLARERSWSGTVILEVFVEKDGVPSRVSVHETSGHKLLDSTAVNAVKQWRFVPAQSGALRFSSKVTVPIQFDLENP